MLAPTVASSELLNRGHRQRGCWLAAAADRRLPRARAVHAATVRCLTPRSNASNTAAVCCLIFILLRIRRFSSSGIYSRSSARASSTPPGCTPTGAASSSSTVRCSQGRAIGGTVCGGRLPIGHRRPVFASADILLPPHGLDYPLDTGGGRSTSIDARMARARMARARPTGTVSCSLYGHCLVLTGRLVFSPKRDTLFFFHQ